MQYAQANQGRIFVLRLEHGEVVHEVVEAFAAEHNINAAALIVLGGADQSSRLVVGPEDDAARPVTAAQTCLSQVHEAAGTGTLFPDEEGHPMLHLHMACGRRNQTITGCARAGVKVWQVMEVVIVEMLDIHSKRVMTPDVGFKLLQP